mgnify:CR=1 FL=1
MRTNIKKPLALIYFEIVPIKLFSNELFSLIKIGRIAVIDSVSNNVTIADNTKSIKYFFFGMDEEKKLIKS